MGKNKETHAVKEDSKEDTAPETATTETIAATETTSASDPLQEMTDLLKRTQANFENYRKQMEKRMEEFREVAAKEVLLEVIPIVDHLELALKNTGHVNQEEFVKGIQLIHEQLMALLEQFGLTVMDTNGKQFDPRSHEALLKVESGQPENTILEEFQKGFLLHGQVIRHAKVKLSAGKKTGQEPKSQVQNNKNTQNNKNNQQ